MYTAPDTAPDTTAGTVADTRRNVAYRALKARLLRGEFPLNGRLPEERLGLELAMSRTPVREALARLHSEGLVARLSDGGFGPTTPQVEAIQELYEVRLVLELYALRRPGRFSPPGHNVERLGSLAEEWRALQLDPPADADPSFVLLDESFHIGLAEAAGNSGLVDLLRQVNERIRVVRMMDFLTADRVSATIDEHLAVVELTRSGDLASAEAALSLHIEQSMAVVQERVKDAIATMAGGGRAL